MLREWDKILGSIEKGKLADLVILNRNPLDDIHYTSEIYMVVKDGNVFKADSIIFNTPEDLAQIQINAYNSHDIESFLAVYSPDVEIYDSQNKLMLKGNDKMRQAYAPFFKSAPNLHCNLVSRKVEGNFVTDQEYITGHPQKGTMEATAKYEIQGGLIKKVWFLK